MKNVLSSKITINNSNNINNNINIINDIPISEEDLDNIFSKHLNYKPITKTINMDFNSKNYK